MNATLRRLLVSLAILGLLYLVGGTIREQLGIEFDVESVRDFVLGLGPAAPLLFVFVVAGRSLLWLPSQVVLIVAGLCFGTLLGAVVGGAGLMISGLFLFAIARYAGRDAIERRLGPRVRHLLDFTRRRSGVLAFGLACSYPLSPLSPLQAAAGWTPMSVPHFIAAAFAGGMVRAGIFAYFGDALTRASWSALMQPLLLFAGVLAIPLLFPSGRTWLSEVLRDPSQTDSSSTAPD